VIKIILCQNKQGLNEKIGKTAKASQLICRFWSLVNHIELLKVYHSTVNYFLYVLLAINTRIVIAIADIYLFCPFRCSGNCIYSVIFWQIEEEKVDEHSHLVQLHKPLR
jgi:hypothetical protein